METRNLEEFNQQTGELKTSEAAAGRQAEIQAGMLVAYKNNRNEEKARQGLLDASKRLGFAEEAMYSYPRSSTKEDGTKVKVNIEGPSVNLAREAGRLWRNIRYGIEVINDTDEFRQIGGFAWDLETNSYVTMEDGFKKVIQRKGKGWVNISQDEREIRELTNRRGAILERNCLLKLIPKDIIEEAMTLCNKTLKAYTKERVITAFKSINVNEKMLEEYLKHSVRDMTSDEIVELTKIGKSIKDGQSTWEEYMQPTNGAEPGEKPEEKKPALDALADRLKREKEAAPPPPITPPPTPPVESKSEPSPVPPPEGTELFESKLKPEDVLQAIRPLRKKMESAIKHTFADDADFDASVLFFLDNVENGRDKMEFSLEEVERLCNVNPKVVAAQYGIWYEEMNKPK